MCAGSHPQSEISLLPFRKKKIRLVREAKHAEKTGNLPDNRGRVL
jgi:hypothetical protein